MIKRSPLGTVEKTNEFVHLFAMSVLIFAGVAGVVHAQAEAPPRRAFAFGERSFTIIDEDKLKPLTSIPLPNVTVDFWWNNAEQDRFGMVVTGKNGLGPATLVVIDLKEQEQISNTAVGTNTYRYNTSSDGNRAYIVLRGPKRKGTASLAAFDTKTGRKLASTSIDELPTDFFLNNSEDGLILVYGGRNRVKEAKRERATLELFDATTLESRKKFDLPGPVTGIYLDSPGYIYLANRGIDRKSDKKRAEGEIYVVNRETFEMQTVPIGMAPGPLAWDDERHVYYVLTAPRATRRDFNAQLHLIKGDGIESTLDLPQLPIAMQPSLNRDAYFILYKDRVMRADKNLTSFKKVMSLDKLPAQLFEHPTNNHFYVLHQAASKVSIVDGRSGVTVSKFKSGSAGKKFGKFMAAFGAQLAMATLVFAAGPAFTVGNTAYYYVPNVVPQGYLSQQTFAAFSEDARFLYVYNTGTNDVTVLDTNTHKVLRKVPGGRSDFRTVLDGRYLCTISPKNVRFFDVDNKFADKATYNTANASIEDIPGTTKAYLSRGRKRAVGIIDFTQLGGIVEMSGVTGQVVHLVDYY